MKQDLRASHLFPKTLFVSLLVTLLSFSGISQNCSAALSVEKDRNAKSADEDGAVFVLTLTNTSAIAQEYTLNTQFLETSCANANRPTRARNVRLDVDFQSATGKENVTGAIRLQPGKSYTFRTRLQVPGGTPFNTWSCLEVQAESKNCNDNVATSLLKVFVPDPSEG